MDRKEFWEDRMKFVNNVMKELFATAHSHGLTVGREKVEEVEKEPFRGLDGSVVPYGKEPRQKRRGETVTFSKFHGAIKDKMVVGVEIGIDQDIWDAWMKGDGYLDTITDSGFQFTEESFLSTEFFLITELYRAAGPEGDLKIDFAMMKALFHAGKMTERMRNEGATRSDRPAKAGRTKNKGYVSEEEVIRVAKDVAKKVKIKSRRTIAERVRKRLLEVEAKKEEPQKVYSGDQIRSYILKEAWAEILE